MTKYRIRTENGRVIGPFEKHELFELKTKGHIKGGQEAQFFPTGNWGPIESFDFYQDLMDEEKTALASSHPKNENTFIVDLNKLRNQRQEKEIDRLSSEKKAPIETLTETIRITPETGPGQPTLKDENLSPELAELVPTDGFELDLPEESAQERHEKTAINPVAQEEIAKIRRQRQEAEALEKALDQRKKEADEQAKKIELAIQAENAPASPHESTQMYKIDKVSLLRSANEAEVDIDKEFKDVQKRRAKEERESESSENDDEAKPQDKKKKILILVAVAALAYALLFPEEEPKKPAFKHLEPQIVFPIPFDVADENKSKAEFNQGLQLFNKGTYPSLVKAGLRFKASYENNLDNQGALNFLVRTYAEELKYSNDKLVDAQTVFNLIQSKKPFLIQDSNGVIGLNLFYMAIQKYDAAIDVVQKYLKIKPKEVTQDLFAVYLMSLIKQGKVDLARQFFQALDRTPEKNHYGYQALVDYLLLNQESEKALAYVDEAIKKNPKFVMFYLQKADLLIKEKKFDAAIPLVKKADELNLDYNNVNRAKYLELKGLIYAYNGKIEEATGYLTQSLKLDDSNALRMKLADLSTSGPREDTNRLINESKAVKLLLEAKTFYEKNNFELALSYAAKATDAFPGHIPSEIFLAEVQMRLGLTQQGLKTLEGLVSKYPEDKRINFALIEAYIETYKFHDAKNRIQIISGTDLKENWEFASVNARLHKKMGDPLQTVSWLKNAINMNPLNDKDIFDLSEILQKKGNYDAARTLLNKCIELDPVNPDYRIAYGRLIYETQDDQAAIGYLLSLQEEFGENPKIMSEIAIFYYRAGKVKDFQTVKAKLEKEHAYDKSLYEFLIKAALLDERNAEVPVLVEKLLTIEPGDLEQMMTAGRVLFEDGKLVESAKWFKRVHDRLPSYPKVLYYIAKIDFLSKDLDGAMKKIQQDIKENGENDADLVFMAQIHIEKQEFVEAENLFKRAQKINPRSYDAIVGLADLSTKRNNHDLALDLYKRAMKLRSDEAIVHKKIGDVYRQLGQGALAIESYRLYLDMEPESPHKSNLEAYINLMK